MQVLMHSLADSQHKLSAIILLNNYFPLRRLLVG